MNLLYWFLATALCTAFFAPPIAYGVKKIFIYDFVLLLWPLIATYVTGPKKLWLKAPRSFLWWCFSFASILTIVFFHGMYRVDLRDALAQVLSLAGDNEAFGPFSWKQDGILYLRFLSWGLALATCIRVVSLQGSRTTQKQALDIATLWGWLALCESLVAIVGFYTPLRQFLGRLYQFDPDYFHWNHRFFGNFPSPLELALALLPGVIWWWMQWRKHPNLKNSIILTIVAFSFFKTKTFSAIIGLGIALFGKHFIRNKKAIATVIALCTFFLIIGFFSGPEIYGPFHSKWLNFKFRWGPWLVFLKTTVSRWDFFLFGLGFARNHTDNSYIHLLRTGGIALFTLCILLLKILLKKPATLAVWPSWYFSSLVALLIAALTTDCLIYRVGGSGLYLLAAFVLAFRSAKQ